MNWIDRKIQEPDKNKYIIVKATKIDDRNNCLSMTNDDFLAVCCFYNTVGEWAETVFGYAVDFDFYKYID
jgi:hypothetical protein